MAINDITLKRGQEVTNGTDGKDRFFANEDNLDAGDVINGGKGYDTLRFFADGNGGNFGAFELNDVERIEVTNDAANPVSFDMSGSFETKEFAVNNSSQSVTFTQITSAVGVSLDIINTTTVGATEIDLLFRNQAVTGANDTVTVNVENTDVDTVRIGRVGDNNAGIENVVLNVTGDETVIQTLDTDLTNLTITGEGDIEVVNALNTSVRNIDASAAMGMLDISFAANSAGVVMKGSQGDNQIDAGSGSDDVTTYAGNDTVNLGEGDNTLDAGAGNNVVNAGSGSDTITTGDDADTIDAGNGNNVIRAGGGANFVITGSGNDSITTGSGADVIFSGNGNDTVKSGDRNDYVVVGSGNHSVDLGSGNDTLYVGSELNATVDAFGNPNGDVLVGGGGRDRLQINALNGSSASDDARFEKVSSFETLEIQTAGTTYLGGNDSIFGLNNAEAAGIKRIDLTSYGNDTVDASTFSRALRVTNYGSGTETIFTGSGSDKVYMFASLDDSDVLQGGGQKSAKGDFLQAVGSTTLTTASQFSGFELLSLLSTRGFGYSSSYSLTLDNDNASSTGVLSIRADTLAAADFFNPDETLTLDASAVTTYSLRVTSGAGADTLQGGALADRIAAGAGDDMITAVGGDTIDAGSGNDMVNLISGNNIVTAGTGLDTVTLGTGSDTVFGNAGEDVIVSGGVATPDQLDQFDVIDGGEQRDHLVVNGAGLTDVAFTGVSRVEILDVEGVGTLTLGARAQAGGIELVNLLNAAASTLNAAAYTADLKVDASAGGDDVITTGSGADTVVAGVGDQTVSMGAGADILRVNGSEFNTADRLDGGQGDDTVELVNIDQVTRNGAAVNAAVNLDLVRSVENYRLTHDGTDPFNIFGNDADTYTLSFTGTSAGGVGSLTEIKVDTSALVDTLDTTQVTLEAGLQDADYEFTVLGSAATTQLIKLNDGVNNNIRFLGGSGVDQLFINGSDLGGTTVFSGGGGSNDAIVQTGGQVTDDGFVGVGLNATSPLSGGVVFTPEAVEILTATGADHVDAILGRTADSSGLEIVDFDNNNANSVLVDAGFTGDLTIRMGGGNDMVNAAASSAALTFVGDVTEFTSGDVLAGGTTAADVVQLQVTGDNQTADLTGMTGVETINFVDNTVVGYPSTHLVLDTAINEVTGGVQTINAADSLDAYFIDAGAATANLVVNLAVSGSNPDIDAVITGSGNDVVNLGAAGIGGTDYGAAPDTDLDHVNTGAGNDIVTGEAGSITTGSGADQVTLTGGAFFGSSEINLGSGNDTAFTGYDADFVQGDAGDDLIDTGAGNDALSGGDGVDTLRGGADNDDLSGGLGGDTLTGGTGSDTFFYGALEDSSFAGGRDTITDFTSGVDKIDLRELFGATGTTIQFVGNAENFADAQSAVLAGSPNLQVVYQQDSKILWADVNSDGTLDGSDLQIRLTGVTSIVASDVFDGFATNGGGQASFDAAHGFDAPFFTQLDTNMTLL